MGLRGKLFSVADFGAGDGISVATSPAGDMVHVAIIEGSMTVVPRDADGSERKLSLNARDELDILVQKSETDPSKTVLVYKLHYGTPGKQDLTWQVAPAKAIVLSAPWADLTVETTAMVTPTPTGKR